MNIINRLIFDNLFGNIRGYEIFLTDSLNASIHIILDYYRYSGNLIDKNSEIWISKTIDRSISNIIQYSAFPSIKPSDQTKGVMIFHQFGYLNDLHSLVQTVKQNNWFLIENCSEALMCYNDPIKSKLMGDAAVFDFSKFSISFSGGAIATKNKEMARFISRKLESKTNWSSYFSLIIKIIRKKLKVHRLNYFFNKWAEMYAFISPFNLKINSISKRHIYRNIINKSLEKRINCKNHLVKNLGGINYFSQLDNSVFTPYAIPLIAEENKLMSIMDQFAKIGLKVEKSHFDLNKDIKNPKFVSCIPIPLDPSFNKKYMNEIIKIIRNVLIHDK